MTTKAKMATDAAVDGGVAAWEKHVDEASGTAYYYNASTGESSWEEPAGLVSPRVQEESAGKARKWREFVDDESGATYYYDEASGTSRWDKPEDFESEQKDEDKHEDTKEKTQEGEIEETAGPSVSEQEPQTAKQEKEPEASGSGKADSSDKETEEVAEDKAAAAAAPQQWVKYVDASTSKPYYFNASTGKTQWEEPEAFEESAAVPATPQVSAEYQAHLNRVRTERLARVTQQVLDPSGNLTKLNAILSGIDSSAPSAPAEGVVAAEDAARKPKAEWQQHIDAQTQRYYYHNAVTGVTQWNKPDAPIVSGVSSQRISFVRPIVADAHSLCLLLIVVYAVGRLDPA
jgi:hypothetical protein